jgi:hypothetical protein
MRHGGYKNQKIIGTGCLIERNQKPVPDDLIC